MRNLPWMSSAGWTCCLGSAGAVSRSPSHCSQSSLVPSRRRSIQARMQEKTFSSSNWVQSAWYYCFTRNTGRKQIHVKWRVRTADAPARWLSTPITRLLGKLETGAAQTPAAFALFLFRPCVDMCSAKPLSPLCIAPWIVLRRAPESSNVAQIPFSRCQKKIQMNAASRWESQISKHF